MNVQDRQKITAEHLARKAYLYVRQSTLRQVFENTESTQRQYALRQRAIALGWPNEQVVVIDTDQGQSSASPNEREGFERLVTEVGMGRAGIVMGLEVARLARNSSDWHRLLEICAVTHTLILDEDGLYDPTHFNDRLLLGLKGAMSEAELHVLHARLRGGLLNKARRGELKRFLAIGFTYDTQGKVALDPDQQIQQSIRLLFATFKRVGSAYGTLRFFREQGLEFPKHIRYGPSKGEVVWQPLTHRRVLDILRHPWYAGAYTYGCTDRRTVQGRLIIKHRPREQWHTFIPEAHAGYISWQQYEENLRQVTANSWGTTRNSRFPPGEGPALLQGMVLCGICGRRMFVHYQQSRDGLKPSYFCKDINSANPKCQNIFGGGIDAAIGQLLLEVVSPLALEVAINVQQEIQARIDESDKLRQKQVERARYEAELARRRFMQIDPDNRLVAATLEAEWNQKLRDLNQRQEEYERHREADRLVLDERMRARISELANDFPKLWRDPKTPARERKRMLGLLVEDVTLIKSDCITIHVRFKGGAVRTITIPRPLRSWQAHETSAEVITHIDRLLDHRTEREIADILNQRGFKSGFGKPFSVSTVRHIRRRRGLKDRYTRLREAGWLTLREIAARLGLSPDTVKLKRGRGLLGVAACKLNDVGGGEYLYADPGTQLMEKRRNVVAGAMEV